MATAASLPHGLFGSGTSAGRGSTHLVEFRAGKMYMKAHMVHPDKRKGLFYVHQADDSLIHLCWKDRSSGVVEDDLIIFPDDCEFKRVSQCTTGRVFVLKFKSSSRNMFFWMQEPKTEKDQEHCTKVNQVLNNPPTPGSTGPGELGGLGEGNIRGLLDNMSQDQLLSLLTGGNLAPLSGIAGLSGSRPSSSQSNASPQSTRNVTTTQATVRSSATPVDEPTTCTAVTVTTNTSTLSTPATTTPTPSATTTPPVPSNPIQLTDLQTILSGITGQQAESESVAVDLSSALNAETIAPIIAKAEIQSQLLPLLPSGGNLPQDHAELVKTIRSPQFKQALNQFTVAFHSGQLGPLIATFGLGQNATDCANRGDLESFMKALQEGKTTTPQDDEHMSTD